MAYMQVKNVLLRAEDLHKFVREFAERRRRQASNDLVEGIFKEVSEHEERRRCILTEFEEQAESRLLETWLQFPGVEQLEQAMEDLSDVDGENEEVILETVLTANEALVEMYDQAMNQTNAPALSELLGRLKDLQDHHLRTMANSVTEFQQS